MSDAPATKIQPWKALKTMEEDPSPDFGKLKNFSATESFSGDGSSVSKPMDRMVGYDAKNQQATVKQDATAGAFLGNVRIFK